MIDASGTIEIDFRDLSKNRFNQPYGEATIGDFYWELLWDTELSHIYEVRCSPLREETGRRSSWKCDAQLVYRLFDNDKKEFAHHKKDISFEKLNRSYSWPQVEPVYVSRVLVNIIVFKTGRSKQVIRTEEPNVDESADGDKEACFLVEGKKIYANKQYLAMHSVVFKAMFQHKLADASGGEEGVLEIAGPFDYEEFRTMIRLILPTSEVITKDNYNAMAEIAECYDVRSIIDKIEYFLAFRAKDDVSVVNKMIMAEKYEMKNLHEHLVEVIDTANKTTVLELLKNPMLEKLSEKNQLIIHRRLAEIEILGDSAKTSGMFQRARTRFSMRESYWKE